MEIVRLGRKHDLGNRALERGIRCDVLGPRLRRVVFSGYHIRARARRSHTRTIHTRLARVWGRRIFTPRDDQQAADPKSCTRVVCLVK